MLATTSIDFSAALATLAEDLCRRLPALQHINQEKVVFALTRSRAEGLHGTYARIAPLRFINGTTELTRRRGHWLEIYRMPALHHNGREILYIIYLMIPRFLRLSQAEKLGTIIHELYHVSTKCDGDIRRFAGRNFAHGSSRGSYNRKIDELKAQYLTLSPDPMLLDFLHYSEEDWRTGQLQLTGLSIPLPHARLMERRKGH